MHSGGATLTQPLQNTILLVEAKDAKGVRLENQPGVTIDRFGYAVVRRLPLTATTMSRCVLKTSAPPGCAGGQ